MKENVILDTGPLVAFLNRRDRFHKWVLEHWDQIQPPMLTCEAVISEACFLLAGTDTGIDSVMQMIQRKIIAISYHLEEHIQSGCEILTQESSVKKN